jgi:hypothetical protein
MSRPNDAAPDPTGEQDDRFPSGPWEGYFLQPGLPGRHGMELVLTFDQGTIRGDGRDAVGDFLIRGTYERDSGKCWWSKRYIGRHDVAYQGYAEGKGIWGTWEISSYFRGGFHIWPVGQGAGDSAVVAEEVDTPVFAGVGADGLGGETLGDSDSFTQDHPW